MNGIAKVSLSLDVALKLSAKCGILKPKLRFAGNIVIQGLVINVFADTIIDDSDGVILKNATVNKFAFNFAGLLIRFKGVNPVYIPIIDHIEKKLIGIVKPLLRTKLTGLLKPQIQTYIRSHLPLTVPMPIGTRVEDGRIKGIFRW